MAPPSKKQMSRSLKLIQKDYLRLSKLIETAQTSIAELKTEAKEAGCTHPTDLCYYWQEDRDNGYGRWWKIQKKKCKLCGTEMYSYGSEWVELK